MSREWVTVPAEPTPEMVEEICRSHTTEEWPNAFGASAQEIRRDYARAGWAAALAAAPHPPIAQPDVLRAAAEKARAALSDLLLKRDPIVYSDALRALDEALAQAPIAQPQAAGWRLPENATEAMQKAMQRQVLLRRSMNDVWRAALAELPEPPKEGDATFVMEAEPPREAWLAYAAAREAAAAGKLRGATAALLEIEAELERVRVVLEAAQNDAMRFRWLTEDHADPQTRAKCRDLLSRMGVMTYSAACRDIDSAMAQTTKREMLRTAVEWQRRCEPTCAHGRYSDEDCADCPRTAAAARAELERKT